MKYKFPDIRTIDDVLPHIEGRSEFIVAEREFGTVINYVVSMADTFDMTGPDDIGGAIRRECRGIIFDQEGNLMSRPFHKFFNISEKEETQIHAINMSQPHVIMEKMDGSMIRPIWLYGRLRLATKMGVTDVSMQAEVFVAENPRYMDFAKWCISNEITPIFEWVSNQQRIVLDYPKDDLILIAARHMITGEYIRL